MCFCVAQTTSKSILNNDKLLGYPDDILANILTPTPSLCETNFELKIDEAVFVGHPTLVQRTDVEEFRVEKDDKADLKEDVVIKMFNIVLVVKTTCNQTVINNYQALSKMIANALRHEEKR